MSQAAPFHPDSGFSFASCAFFIVVRHDARRKASPRAVLRELYAYADVGGTGCRRCRAVKAAGTVGCF